MPDSRLGCNDFKAAEEMQEGRIVSIGAGGAVWGKPSWRSGSGSTRGELMSKARGAKFRMASTVMDPLRRPLA